MKLLSKVLIALGTIVLLYALTMNSDLKNIVNNDKQNYIIMDNLVLVIKNMLIL